MRRLSEAFNIWQAVPAKSFAAQILQALPEESSPDIRRPLATESGLIQILQPVAGKSLVGILPLAAAESEDRIPMDFSKHRRVGWTHYRILLGVDAGLKRGFYFDQAAQQRWTTRELQRQIDRALFERVAISRDTKALVRLEKQRGPVETVRYEDAFKDPYLLDFLGLKGAYSEKDLEAAIIANLQQFLSELGSDFCFIARQFAMQIDDNDLGMAGGERLLHAETLC